LITPFDLATCRVSSPFTRGDLLWRLGRVNQSAFVSASCPEILFMAEGLVFQATMLLILRCLYTNRTCLLLMLDTLLDQLSLRVLNPTTMPYKLSATLSGHSQDVSLDSFKLKFILSLFPSRSEPLRRPLTASSFQLRETQPPSHGEKVNLTPHLPSQLPISPARVSLIQ
jgi:hypothetical protein